MIKFIALAIFFLFPLYWGNVVFNRFRTFGWTIKTFVFVLITICIFVTYAFIYGYLWEAIGKSLVSFLNM